MACHDVFSETSGPNTSVDKAIAAFVDGFCYIQWETVPGTQVEFRWSGIIAAQFREHQRTDGMDASPRYIEQMKSMGIRLTFVNNPASETGLRVSL